MLHKMKIYKIAGIVAPVMFTCFVLLGGLLRPDYSAFSQTISVLILEGAPNKMLLDTGFAISNFFLALFGYGLCRMGRRDSNKYKSFAGYTLIAGGISGILIILFPADPEYVSMSVAGFIHHFTIIMLTIFALISILFSELGEFHNGQFRSYSKISLIIIFIFAVITVIAGASKDSFVGLYERITIVVYFQWLIVMSLVAVRYSLSEQNSEKIKRLSNAIIVKAKKAAGKIIKVSK